MGLLNRRDPYHQWAADVLKQVKPPLFTCEAVLTETAYFLRDDAIPCDDLFALLDRDVIRVEFDFTAQWPRMRTLMARYPQMDFADACVVVMTEQRKHCQVLTVDAKDFAVYRRNDRQVIPFVAPRR